jgi:predicted PolB exonuclease-like 3'-5' exonuclease
MQKKIVAFDLETIADPAMIDILPEVKPAGNLKDPAKIEADIEAKKMKQIADMGLSPAMNMICCAGWAWLDDDGNIQTDSLSITEASADQEKNLLLKFWDALGQFDHFVSYNGRHFDLRCMLLHGIGYGIRPSVNIDKGRYNRTGSNHTDLRPILAGEDKFASGKLDFFCRKFLGDQKTDGIDGAQVQSFFDMGLTSDVEEYCKKDCELTLRLFQKVETAGLIE